MNVINDMISLISREECRQFELFLKVRSKRQEARNIDLFKALQKGEEEKVRAEIGNNAYYVLNKRLTDTLADFLAARILENEMSEEAAVIRQLALSRKLIQHQKYKSAHKLLKRAEKTAIQIQHHTLLNEIYHLMIEISHTSTLEDQQELINKLETNTRLFLQNERLNLIYAQVKKAYFEDNFDDNSIPMTEFLNQQFRQHGISLDIGFGFKSLYQIAMIMDIAGTASRNYATVEVFFADKLKTLTGSNQDTERNALFHINLLYTLANISFRKRDFEESLLYLSRMKRQMHRFDGKYAHQSLPKYTLLLALNNNFNGAPHQALKHLNSFLEKETKKGNEFLSIKLTQAMILMQQNQDNEAMEIMRTFYRSDSYYRKEAGLDWLLNYRIMEIILHINRENYEFASTRVKSLLRQYGSILKEHRNVQALPFLKLLRFYINHPHSITSDSFLTKVEKNIPWKKAKEEDIFMISIYAWLKSKMVNSPLYETTLDLVASK